MSAPMTLLDALGRINAPIPEDAPTLEVLLACGFTPLHLRTFLTARLREAYPHARVELSTGLYGDLAAMLEGAATPGLEAIAVVIEWQDLDPRLGLRALGGWRAADLADIIETAARQSQRLADAITRLARDCRVVVVLPSLPLPPLFPTPLGQAGADEQRLRRIAADLAADLAATPGVRLVGAQELDMVSPLATRLDARSDLATGFPYSLSHASALAGAIASLVGNERRMKGLITDLDDTLWAGLLGEIGVDGIGWSLEHNAQAHGLYQQLLASLASAGILIAVASKNDPDLVAEAFSRSDLLVSRELIFPIAAGWGAKSQSVGQILASWNVGADSVLFIDDSPMELAEVAQAFPDMACLAFPGRDAQALWPFLRTIRDLFGKSELRAEDALRLASLRGAETFRAAVGDAAGAPEAFLQAAGGTISFAVTRADSDGRALELINKTNQFNLNGERLSESAWRAYLADEAAFLLTASYRDKFGDLGKIGAMLGRAEGRRIVVDTWVLSCRAFSRRIEHETLRRLFEQFSADEVQLDFRSTARNGPARDFLAEASGDAPAPGMRISRGVFLGAAPAPVHTVEDATDG